MVIRWLLFVASLAVFALPLQNPAVQSNGNQSAGNRTTGNKTSATSAAGTTAGHSTAQKAPGLEKAFPNIVLITLDTTRADRLGFMGSRRGLTPNLDELARQSAVFTRAYAQAPLTSPSHATILTGTYPQYHRVLDFPDELGEDLPYAPAILQSHGYRTAAFIASLALDPHGGAPGFDRGFDVYNAGFSSAKFLAERDRYNSIERRADEVASRATTWLNHNPTGPFFIWVHLYDPHEPYDPPEPYKSRYAAEPYDGEIAYMDSAVGKLLRELKTLGLYDGTMIAVMADHGESLGAHGEDTHGFFLYDETIHVPLVIKLPHTRAAESLSGGQTIKVQTSKAQSSTGQSIKRGQTQDRQIYGRRIDDRVGLVDVMPTMLQAAGIAVPAEVQGESLLALMTTTTKGEGEHSAATANSWRDRPAYSQADYPHLAFGWSALQSLRTGKYLYIQAPRRELYDQTVDPEAEHNLAETSAAVADTLASQVHAFQDKTTSKREAPKVSDEKVAALDPALQQKLASLGYVTGDSQIAKPSDEGADPKDKIAAANTIRNTNALLDNGHYEEAVPILQKLIAQEPEMPMLYFKLGGVYMHLQQYDKAYPMLTKAVELDPKFTMAELDLGKTMMRLGDVQGATAVLERLTARVPNLIDAHLLLEIAYARANRPETISECEKVLKIIPEQYGTYMVLGRYLAKSGDPEAALLKLEKAAALRPQRAEPHFALAEVYDQLGRKEDAARERTKADRMKQPAQE
jgi:arylsulfatase A-like enzyme/Tfp pilus assembly protein PilF